MALNHLVFVLVCVGFVNTQWVEPEIRKSNPPSLRVIVTVLWSEFFFLILLSFYWKKSADYLNICAKSDENLTSCLNTSMETFRLALNNGIPNIETKSIDPLDIGDLFEAHKKRHEITVKVQHIIVMGFLKFKIDKIEWVFDHFQWLKQ